jgi:predicted PurR-regulated permease PerM
MYKFTLIVCCIFCSLISFPFFVNANVKNLNQNVINMKLEINHIKEEISDLKEEVDNNQTEKSTQKDTYELLLQREKDITSSLYDFTTMLVVVITFFVTIAGVIIGILITKLKKHQDKINLVLNSKEFDDKVKKIEDRLIELRLKERESYKSKIISEFNQTLSKVEANISSVESALQEDIVPNVQQLAKDYDFEYLKARVVETVDLFREFENNEISPEDDDDDDTINLEEDLASWLEELNYLDAQLKNLLWVEIYPV